MERIKEILMKFYYQQKYYCIFSAFIFALVILFYFFDFSFLWGQIAHEKQKNASLQKQMNILNLKLQKSRVVKQQSEDLNNKLSDVSKQFSLYVDFSTFLRVFAQVSKAVEVDVISITPQKEINSGNYIITPVEVIVSGYYSELAGLIFYLCEAQFFLIIKQMELKPVSNDDNDSKKLIMKITFDFYKASSSFPNMFSVNKKIINLPQKKFNNSYSKQSGIPAKRNNAGNHRSPSIYSKQSGITARRTQDKHEEHTFCVCNECEPKCNNAGSPSAKSILRDPFAFSGLKDKKNSLISWQIQELQMIGIIREDNTIWGVVKTPYGDTYHVSEGDFIGTNKSRIVSISANEIRTSNTNDFLVAKYN